MIFREYEGGMLGLIGLPASHHHTQPGEFEAGQERPAGGRKELSPDSPEEADRRLECSERASSVLLPWPH